MEKHKPLLSIAIATKNREYYCIEAIKSILRINSNDFEIVISDNSNSMLIGEFISSRNDHRVVYKHYENPLSFIENFNKCFELASGEYICLIGDDDGVLPEIIEKTKWAKENQVDSFCNQNTPAYYWPNSIKSFPNGALIFNKKEKFEPIKINIQDELVALLKNGIQHYLLFKLPRLYHGVVKRDLFLKIKEISGHYFGGLSPDIYSAISLSFVCQNHYMLDTPVTIAGVCTESASAKNFTGKHSGRFEDTPHLKFLNDYEWSNLIPKYYSVNTIWAETGIKAFEEFGKKELVEKYYNPFRMMAQGFINNYKFIRPVMIEKMYEYCELHQIHTITYTFNMIISFIKIVFKKLGFIFKKKKSIKLEPIRNIEEAIFAISNTKA